MNRMNRAFRRGRPLWRTSLVAAAFLVPLRLVAQVPHERTVPLEQEVKDEMERSRFHLGPIRLFPLLLLNDVGYDNNIFGTPPPTVSDWTAKAAVGLHMLMPAGPKMYLRGDALPEYDWYAHHVEKRTFGGRYGIAWLGFFNRMSVDLTGESVKTVNPFSTENELFVVHKTLNGAANVEVNVSRQWLLLAGAEGHRLRFSSQGTEPTPIPVQDLERDEVAGRAGIRFRPTTFFNVAAEVEETQTGFLRASQRDNRTTAYLLGVYYNRERFFVNLNGGYRVGRPYNGSSFPSFSTGTGSYFVSYFLTQPIEIQAFGHRTAGYSLYLSNGYYFETRNGGGLTLHIGHRLRLHGFGEYGTNDYPVPVPSATAGVNRTDHFTTAGGGLTAAVTRSISLTALVNQSKISSNVPGVARSVLRFTTNLSFEGSPPR